MKWMKTYRSLILTRLLVQSSLVPGSGCTPIPEGVALTPQASICNLGVLLDLLLDTQRVPVARSAD